ncbi:hypothetical protein B0J11DRAFT_432462 [Dendryphion nanum]|uniref:PARP catalytic domain-containing protein n=1 Tax=Dendryphion nanum TaxID=256645 RepID=A0A9P9DX34_9PLEO|nr:hypothetical protein B0J11DRAFT_432462 [Dendryphion nanum]
MAWCNKSKEYAYDERVAPVLDTLIPKWRCLSTWEPDIMRVTILEKIAKDQKVILRSIIELEGPDTITGLHARLVGVEFSSRTCGLDISQADFVLTLLSRCQSVGPHTVDLFIHFFVDADARSLEKYGDFVQFAVGVGDDNACRGVLQLLTMSVQDIDVGALIRSLAEHLPILETSSDNWFGWHALESPIRFILNAVVEQAQRTFLDALRTSSAGFRAMQIQNLVQTIESTRSLHRILTIELREMIQQFPPRGTLITVLERISAKSAKCSIQDCRLKSYLASALGGQEFDLDDGTSLVTIEKEVAFWKAKPDVIREALVANVSSARTITYALYTSWLATVLREEDDYIRDVERLLSNVDVGVLDFAQYLEVRRRFGRMQDDTWLMVFAGLLAARGPNYLRNIAAQKSIDEWLDLMAGLRALIHPIRHQLPRSGDGLTRSRLEWWDRIEGNASTVQRLLQNRNATSFPLWLYLPDRPEVVSRLIRSLDIGTGELQDIYDGLIPHLDSDGSNLTLVCEAIESASRLSSFGVIIYKRMIVYTSGRFSPAAKRAVIEFWIQNVDSLTTDDAIALTSLVQLLNLPSSDPTRLATFASSLRAEYQNLIDEAFALERVRGALQRSNRDRIEALLSELHIDSTMVSPWSDTELPEGLVDAVEVVDDHIWEMSFPVTALNELQRAAKGIPLDARMVIVCFDCRPYRSRGNRGLCIHFVTDDDPSIRHSTSSTVEPTGYRVQNCSSRSMLFGYYLSKHVGRLINQNVRNWEDVHATIEVLIASAPRSCLLCLNQMHQPLWKPTTCSRACSRSFRQAPLEVRLHNLLIDPDAIDLLFTSVFLAVADPRSVNLLPPCPIPVTSLHTVINSFPPLQNLQTATDLRTAIQSTDTLGRSRELFLSWLCLHFRSLILAAPSNYRIPSLGPSTKQFLIPNTTHDRESTFRMHYATTNTSTPVFHGTRASRLFPILTDGLRVAANNNTLMLNGAAYGQGIYCGHEPSTSQAFAGSTGQSWRHSQMSNLKVLLGCELAPATPPTHAGNVHVLTDEGRLAVRYVWLTPVNGWTPPIRGHVETGMGSAFARLRAGMQ